MKTMFRKLFAWINKVWDSLDDETKDLVPVAISITNSVKWFVDSQVGEFSLTLVKNAIPGTIDDLLIDRVHAFIDDQLPDVILKLKLIESVAKIDNKTEKVIAILNFLKKADISEKTNFWIGLSAVILDCLKDGKLTVAEATIIIQAYYKGKIKN